MISWAETLIGDLIAYFERASLMYTFFSIIIGLKINCQTVHHLLQRIDYGTAASQKVQEVAFGSAQRR